MDFQTYNVFVTFSEKSTHDPEVSSWNGHKPV